MPLKGTKKPETISQKLNDEQFVIQFNNDGKVLFANQNAVSYFGENFNAASVFGDHFIANLPNVEFGHSQVFTEVVGYNINHVEKTISWNCTLVKNNHTSAFIFCVGTVLKNTSETAGKILHSFGLDLLFYNNPSIMALSDFKTGKFIEINETFSKFTGLKKSEVIGKTPGKLHLLPEENIQNTIKELLTKTGKVSDFEFQIVNPKNQILWFAFTAEVIRDKGKKYVLSSAIDITNLKKHSEFILQNESNFRSFFDSLNELIFILDNHFNIRQFNKAVTHKLGYEYDGLSGESFLKIVSKSKGDSFEKLLKAVVEDETLFESVKLVHSEGIEMLFEIILWKGYWNNQPAVMIAASDTAEKQNLVEKLRESKASLKSIIQTSPDSIALFSRELELITFNSAFAGTIFQITGKIVRRNLHLKQIFSGKLKILWENLIQSVEENQFVEKDLEILLDNGQKKYYYNVFQPVFKENQLIGYSQFIRDITEKKTQEIKIAESEKRLNEAQQIAKMGHITINFLTGEMNISRQTYNLAGIEPDLSVKKISDLYKYVHTDDLQFVKQYRYNLVKELPLNFQAEIRIIDINHQTKYIRLLGRTECHGQRDKTFFAITLQDITTQKHYEIDLHNINDQLIKNHQQLRAIFDTVPGAMIVLDREKNIIDLNSTAFSIFNIDQNTKIKGLSAVEIFSSLHIEINDLLNEVFNLSKFVSTVISEVNGKTYKIYISPVIGKDNLVHGAVIIMMDITDLKQTTVALEESETRLQMAIDGANEGLWDWDVKQHSLFVNEQWFNMLGYNGNGNQIPWEFWLELIHPDDFQYTVQALENHLTGNSEMFESEFRMRTKKGQYKWFLAKGKVVKRDADGKPLRLLGTHMDVTQRRLQEESLRESENRLKLALEGANEGLWDWNLNTGEAFFSQSWLDMLGYSRNQAEETYEWWEDLIHLDDVATFRKCLKRHLTGESKHFEAEYRMRKSNGEWIWILGHGKVIEYGKDGKPVRIIGTQLDITERKNMMKAVEKTEKELRELVATKDKLFSIIAHDLKNPFNLMAGFSELLSSNYEEYDTETIQKFINIIYNASVQGNQLLENLLQWSRAQTGRLVVSPKKINTYEIIESTIRILKPNAESKGVTLVINDPQNYFIWADSNIVETIIRNLVSNAIKFSIKDQKVTIETTENNDFIEIAVIDRGVGMTPETVEKLFKLSTIQSTAGTANEKGTGLGLLICKEFAEKNGGEMFVESRFGFGSRFWFTIPKYKNQD